MALNFPANPVDKQIYQNFKWSETIGAWQFFSPLELNQIEGVTVPAPAKGDILYYDGNGWINSSPEEANLSDKDLGALFWMYA